MGFKQAPSVVGVLQQTAPTSALTLTVDNAFASYLRGLLSSADWTYIVARVGNSVETMRVTAVDPAAPVVTVTRGLDGQTLTLAPGQELEYQLLAQAVTDILNVAALAPAISITGEGALSVAQAAPGQFVLSAPYTNITSSDGSLLVNQSQDGYDPPQNFNVDITANTSAIGCCTSSGY